MRIRLRSGLTLIVLAAASLWLTLPVFAEQFTGGTLTLEQAIALALERNLGYANAQLAARSSESAARQAGDEQSLQVSLGGEYDRQDAELREGPGLTLTVGQTYPGLLPAVSLPGYPLPLSPVALARAGEDLARTQAEKARGDLVFNVIQAYYGVLKASRLREVQEAALASAEAAGKVTAAKVNAGAATRVDLLRAEMDIAEAELAVAKAKNAYATAQTALFALLSLEAPATPVTYAPVAPAEAPRGTQEELTEHALAQRAEVTVAALNLKEAESRENQAKLGTLPSVNLTGSLSGERHLLTSDWNPVSGTLSWSAQTGTHELTGPGRPLPGDWNLGIAVTYPLYDAGARQEAVLQAQLRTAQARNSLEQARNAVAAEVQEAWFQLAEARLNVEAARKAKRLSAESRRLTSLRVENGVGTPAELSEANANYLAAQVNLVQAEFAEQIALAKLKRAAGLL